MGAIRLLIGFFALIFSLGLASAVIVNSVDVSDITPGEIGSIALEIENIFDEDVDDLVIRLDLTGLPFTPVGSSEEVVDELEEDEDEDFTFRVRAANDIAPGDYQIPYIISFERNGEDKDRTGTIGIRVGSTTELTFSIDAEDNIVGNQGKVILKLVNSGFSDARFVSVKLLPDGYTLLSDSVDYIGTIDSDDFETASFDVIFNGRDIDFTAVVEYTNFNNERIVQGVSLPVTVYTTEEAIELGIISRSNTGLFVSIFVLLILIWIAYRVIKKQRRVKRSKGKGK